MTLPRKSLISLADTPFYHCVSRCVRRAFLCGVDHYSARSYEHRRDWLEYKLLSTADVFAIKLCSYAVMSNHYHVVLHVRSDMAQDWSEREVVERWHRLFSGTLFSQALLNGEPLSSAQWQVLRKDIKTWRNRLCSISWFMLIVNETIARQANKEDNCTGRFWEGRFKSQALLDDQALLSCMAYVDLNPVRAKMANTPEESNYTSIKYRLNRLKKDHEVKLQNYSGSLEKLVGITNENIGVPYRLKDYLELVDWSGRIIREDKRGHISKDTPDILNRLNLDSNSWKILTTEFEERFQCWVGSEQIVKKVCEAQDYKRMPPTKAHAELF